jgi:hypothetical protein
VSHLDGTSDRTAAEVGTRRQRGRHNIRAAACRTAVEAVAAIDRHGSGPEDIPSGIQAPSNVRRQ